MIPSRRIKNIFMDLYRVGATLKKSRIFFETRNPSKKIYYNISKTHNSEPFKKLQDEMYEGLMLLGWIGNAKSE